MGSLPDEASGLPDEASGLPDEASGLVPQALETKSVQGPLLALGVSDTAFDVFDEQCFASHGSGSRMG